MADTLAKLRVMFESSGAGVVVDDARRIETATGRMARNLADVALAAGGVAGGLSFAVIVKESIDAALAIERLAARFSAAAGGASAAAAELAFIRDEAARLGLVFSTTADQYGRFLAATRNTAVEGEAARRIFTGVSEAVTALQLSSDEAGGIFTAMTQMLSKGRVQAEELTGQLSERLPGALDMAARSMGMTRAELLKHVSAGEVLAADLLPKLAEELHKTYGQAAVEAAAQGQGAINRFKTEVVETAAAIGEYLTPAVAGMADAGGGALKEFRRQLTEFEKDNWADKIWRIAAAINAAINPFSTLPVESFRENDARALEVLNPSLDPSDRARQISRQGESAYQSERLRATKEAAEKQLQLELQMAEERNALAERQMKINLDRTRQEGQTHLAILEANYSRGLIDTRNYYEERLSITQANTDAELAYLTQRQNDVQRLLAEEKAPAERLKLQKELLDLQRDAARVTQDLSREQITIGVEYADALERQRTEILSINDATQQSYQSLLSVLGVRREIVDVLSFEYESSRQVADIQHEIERSMADPAKLSALQAQLDMENELVAAKRAQLQATLEISLQNEQFALEQQRITLLQKQGLEEEAFQRQQALDLLRAETDYRQKMVDYQNELNTATQAGLEKAATLIRQNMSMYQELYQQTVSEINSRTFSPAATSGGGSSTTNWSGLAGTYTRTVGTVGTGWGAAIKRRQEEEAAAAAAAAEAWQKAREAAITMADDLSVRFLKVTGRAEEASIQKLVIDQEAELKKAREAGLDTTQLLAVQQLEYNKVVLDIQKEANDKAQAAHEAYLKAQAEAEGRYYGTGLDLLKHLADEARNVFEETKNQLESSLQDYASSISDVLGEVNDTIRTLERAAADLRTTATRLLGGSDSILSPEQKYLQARLAYTTTATAAMGGDIDALQRLGGLAEAFIAASRSYYASGSAYATDFSTVQDVLSAAAAKADELGANLDPQVDLLTRQLDVLAAIRDAIKVDNMQALQEQLGQLEANNTALAALTATTSGVGTAVTTGTGGVSTLLDQYKSTYIAKQDAAQTVLDITADNAYNTWQQAQLTAARVSGISTVATNTGALSGINTAVGTTASNTGNMYAGQRLGRLKESVETVIGVTSYNPVAGVTQWYPTTKVQYTYYARGGVYPGGLAVMGEEGPELVDSSPGYVYTAQETREILQRVKSSGDNAEAVAELKGMNAELREQNRQLAAAVATLQAGFNELIRGGKNIERRMEGLESKARLAAA